MTDKKSLTDIRAKVFAEQCTPLKKGSVLSLSQEFLTQENLCSLDFGNDKILKLIWSLNMHKAVDMMIYLPE